MQLKPRQTVSVMVDAKEDNAVYTQFNILRRNKSTSSLPPPSQRALMSSPVSTTSFLNTGSQALYCKLKLCTLFIYDRIKLQFLYVIMPSSASALIY